MDSKGLKASTQTSFGKDVVGELFCKYQAILGVDLFPGVAFGIVVVVFRHI